MKTTDASTVKRRSFLKGAAVTTVAVGSGAISHKVVAEQKPEDKVKPKQGYRETDHIKEYYRLARF